MRGLYAAGRQADALVLFAEHGGCSPTTLASTRRRRWIGCNRDAASRPEPGRRRSTARGRYAARPVHELRRARGGAAAGAWVAPRAALVTLVGPGGTGKSRLAVELAARERGGVRLVELAPIDLCRSGSHVGARRGPE